MKKIVIATFSVIVIILLSSNLYYYLSTRNELIQSQQQQVSNIVSNIKSSLETNYSGNRLFENEIAEGLRMASLATEAKLPAHVKDITNEQLVQLAKEIGVDDITLMVKDKKENYFICVKSSDPKEVGTNTKDWGDNWNGMFSQVMGKKQKIIKLEPNFGQVMKYFWAGPPDTSSNHPGRVYNWGYYFDGKTDYMIDPFISDATLVNYNNIAGVDATIKKAIKNNPVLLEIGVVNYNKMGTMNKKQSDMSLQEKAYRNRMVVDGKFHYETPLDKKYSTEAIQTKRVISKVIKIDDKQILKTYMPINLEINGNIKRNKMITIISSDYSIIKDSLWKKEVQALLVTFIIFVIGILLTVMLTRYIKRQSLILANVQAIFSDNIKQLLNTIQEHQHDFKHHLFTLQGLLNLKRYQDMDEYISNLTKVQVSIGEDISINITALKGLIRTKISEAVDKHIQFSHHFEKLEALNLDDMKLMNLIRVIGNILNNAFHAVMSNDESNRKVIIRGNIKDEHIVFKLYNNGPTILPEHLSRIFEHGFSTKKESGGSGIGLASSKKIIKEYKGTLTVTSDEEWTIFTIEIPIAKISKTDF
ncbi:GHKL domain-containing protein [Bacillus sp. BRMEA1]|uniref:sensor histidine kinase n=1 Tax=Neobacillus endophyticus TaxID=2738405 RepID=UPI001566D713|nr:ATP-binding protein [Neobacillus endophyticus]NRD76645.1 GHKL domain-containing protein [Neobacillus endophyticus]